MKQQQFTHRCRSCGYRWFTYQPKAVCSKCGSSRRETFKLVPYLHERRVRLELGIYAAVIAVGTCVAVLLR